jgi:CHASE3 domain sensor protein
MAKKTENKAPVTTSTKVNQLKREYVALRQSMILLEKEAHQNGLEIAEAKEAINKADDRTTSLVQMFNGRHDVVNTRLDCINTCVDDLTEEANRNFDAIAETFKRNNRRLAVTLILSGVAIGMTILFTTFALLALFSIESGGQIIILRP